MENPRGGKAKFDLKELKGEEGGGDLVNWQLKGGIIVV